MEELVYVLEFSKETNYEDITWLLRQLKESGLILSCGRQPSSGQALTVFVSIDNERIVSVASKCRIRTVEGLFIDDHLNSSNSPADEEYEEDDLSSEQQKSKQHRDTTVECRGLFTEAEILWMTRHEIDNVRSATKQSLLVGKARITLFQGQSIVEKFHHKKLIEKIYPLHDQEKLKRLGRDWYGGADNVMSKTFQPQPLSGVREYYGEGVAFYFAFLESLTWALAFPSIVGIIQLYSPTDFYTRLFFCFLYILWAFALMEWWKRRSNGLCFQWGTRNKFGGAHAEPRANYRGELVEDPITGTLLPLYPRWKTLLKLYGASLPVVLVCTAAAFWLMLESIWKESLLIEWTLDWTTEEAGLLWQWIALGVVSVPTVIYAALVWVANMLYRRLATKLTEWENHRTESQFERNRVTKLLLFEFVNNFMSLFYIAFYLKDIPMLRWQVALMLIVFQVINQLTETLLPYYSNLQQSKQSQVGTATDGKEDEASVAAFGRFIVELERMGLTVLEADHQLVVQANKESLLEPYEGTHDDYLELFIQFGYVILFVVAYPAASLWAWVNNVAELRVDAFKLVRIHRRPPPARVAHIGAWQPAFRLMCSIAVVSNCALVYVMSTTGAQSAVIEGESAKESSWWNRAIVCVAADHLLLVVQSLLDVLVPAVPKWVHLMASERRRRQQQFFAAKKML